MEYAIYEEFFPDVEKKLKRVVNKCKKHGNEFTYEILREEIREFERQTESGKKYKEYYNFIIIDVAGTAKIDDWECIAVLEYNKEGNIIRRINTEIEVPERFRTSSSVCEHCNTKRERKNLYIIHNVKTDEWKQVGGSCLALYTGGLNLEYVASYMDGITKIEEYDGFIGGSGKPYYNVKDVLAFATEVIDKTGYFNSDSDLPTKDMVKEFLFNGCDVHEGVLKCNHLLDVYKIDTFFTNKDFNKDNTDARVEKMIEYYLGLEDNSEFIHNIQVMLKTGYVLAKNFGFVCYVPEGYAKHIQREIARAERLKENKAHYGEVGKRYKDKQIVSVNVITTWYNDFGSVYLYKIVIKDGNELYPLTWKSSKYIFSYDVRGNEEEFDKITFTVKEHSEYKGLNQTEVTRCKVTYKEAKKEVS